MSLMTDQSIKRSWFTPSRVILSTALTLLYQPIYNSKFWLLDDHHIVDQLHQEKSGLIHGIWYGLHAGNLFDWGHGPRFTPTLDLFFAFRAAIFGGHTILYFLFSIVLLNLTAQYLFSYAVQLFKLFDIEFTFEKQIGAIAAIALFFLNSSSTEVYGRLGTSELIGTFFLSVILAKTTTGHVYGFTRKLCSIITLNCLLLIGTKEDYLWVFIYIYFITAKSKIEDQKSRVIMLMVTFFYSVFIIAGFGPYLIQNRKNVYGAAIGANSLKSGIASIFHNKLVITIIILMIINLIPRFGKINFRAVLPVVTPVFLIFLTDIFYYGGNLVNYYRTNMNLILSILLISLIIGISVIVKNYLKSSRIVLVALLLFLVPLFSEQILLASKAIHARVVATNNFHAGLTKIIYALNHNQKESKDFVFLGQSNWDYETIISLSEYLDYYQAKGKRYIEIIGPRDSSTSAIVPMSEQGIQSKNYDPISTRNSSHLSVCVFSENEPKSIPNICADIIQLKWLA